jgi:rsbT antagonist protein RsbS
MKIMGSDFETVFSGIYEMDGCLIVPIQEDIDSRNANEIGRRILIYLEHHSLKLVLIDLSAVSVLDRKTFQIIMESAGMIRLMGAKTVFAGIQPGVASALVDLDVDIHEMQTALSIREGIDLLRRPDTSPQYNANEKFR